MLWALGLGPLMETAECKKSQVHFASATVKIHPDSQFSQYADVTEVVQALATC